MGWETSDRKSRLPSDWDSIRYRVLRRDSWSCRLRGPNCLGAATEVDHRIAGDNHEEENLQSACSRCHAEKSSSEGNQKQARIRARRKRPEARHPGRL